MGASRAPRPDPHFAPFQTSIDVRGASCFAIPLSRLFFAYRIRSLHSSFFIAYRCVFAIFLIPQISGSTDALYRDHSLRERPGFTHWVFTHSQIYIIHFGA